MLRLAQLLADCGISRRDLRNDARADGVPLASKTLLALLNDATWPLMEGNRLRLQGWLEEYVTNSDACMAWLAARELELPAIWDEVEGSGRYLFPAGFGGRVAAGWQGLTRAIEPGDPHTINRREDTVMINCTTLKHFGLFRDPFANEIAQPADIYGGEEHVFLREMMLEAARNSGFVAVAGECGCGKSVMRKTIVGRLGQESTKVIYPVIVDKTRITAGSLVDAIIMDISDEMPKRALEAKTRQAIRLLQARAASGLKQVLIVEEAHLLNARAIKALKQIHEFETGYAKLLGIILIGQPELKYMLDESRHPELREVIRRVTMAEIRDLGGEIQPYLEHKFKRVGGRRFEEIIAPDAIEAIAQRLPGKAYPLSVNNLVAKAMDEAAKIGEAKVTAEIVLEA